MIKKLPRKSTGVRSLNSAKPLNTNYRILIYKEGMDWIAEAVDLPGCATHASTRIKAVQAMENLIPDWLRGTLKSRGKVPSVIEGPLTVTPPADVAKAVRRLMARKAGAAGRGVAKARTSEQARAAVRIRWDRQKMAA